MTSYSRGSRHRLQPMTKPAILIMTSFATELATPSVADVQTYGHLTAFNIRIKITMGDIKVKDRLASKELIQRLGIDDIILVPQRPAHVVQWSNHLGAMCCTA